MKCKNEICGKELVGRLNKKFCDAKCRNGFHVKKLVFLSTTLKPEQIREIKEIESRFLAENRKEVIKNEEHESL